LQIYEKTSEKHSNATCSIKVKSRGEKSPPHITLTGD
jgi:hypothetical protein